MIELTANGEKKAISDEFVDVTLNQLSAAYEFVNNQDPTIKRYLLSDTEADIDKDKFFEFKLNWIVLFSDFTVEELRLVPLEENDFNSLSIEWLYDHCKLFLDQPETYIEIKEFKHNKRTYNLLEPLKTISGAKLLFGNGNYRQFMLGSQLTNMVKDSKGGKGIESLKQLFALLYSDGNDSSEDIAQRSKDFGEVNALYGWSAYFFFVQLVEKYKDYFQSSTTKNPKPKIARELAIQQLRALLLKTSFGKWLLSKLPKREYSILRT